MKYLKKVIIGAFILYTFNVIAVNFNIVIPINIWTLFFTSFFDITAIVVMLLIKIIGL